jgi:hypothetical protein
LFIKNIIGGGGSGLLMKQKDLVKTRRPTMRLAVAFLCSCKHKNKKENDAQSTLTEIEKSAVSLSPLNLLQEYTNKSVNNLPISILRLIK